MNPEYPVDREPDAVAYVLRPWDNAEAETAPAICHRCSASGVVAWCRACPECDVPSKRPVDAAAIMDCFAEYATCCPAVNWADDLNPAGSAPVRCGWRLATFSAAWVAERETYFATVLLCPTCAAEWQHAEKGLHQLELFGGGV